MRWCLALCLVGSCNQTYGLDETILVDVNNDADGDQIIDGLDNCPNVPNPAQEDRDDDTFGDACDHCPTTMDNNHDEDGDGRGDACDSCPGLADFAGNDNDHDGIGDQCDMQSGYPSGQLLFDPFLVIDGWTGDRAAWAPTGDAVAPTTQLALDDGGLTPRELRITGNAWWMAVGYAAATKWSDGDQFGVWFSDEAGDSGAIAAGCFVECAAGQCSAVVQQFANRVKTMLVTATPRFEIAAVARTGGLLGIECLYNGAGLGATTMALPSVMKPHIVATPRVQAAFAFVAN